MNENHKFKIVRFQHNLLISGCVLCFNGIWTVVVNKSQQQFGEYSICFDYPALLSSDPEHQFTKVFHLAPLSPLLFGTDCSCVLIHAFND